MSDNQMRIVEVKLPNGTTMYAEARSLTPVIETEATGAKGGIRLGRIDEETKGVFSGLSDAEIPVQDFEAVMGTVQGIAQAVSKTAESSNAVEMNVEFGLELGLSPAGLTALFVSGSGKASLKISLKWTNANKTTEQKTLTEK